MIKKSRALVALVAVLTLPSSSWAGSPAELNDLEIAHVAYTADLIDIRYAHLALAISKNPQVRAFAETMIRDHSAVNDRALALLGKLDAKPQDNFLSQQLVEQSEALVAEMRRLNGREFDWRYATNELDYHRAVNDLVEKTFLRNLQHPEVKGLFKDALVIFKAHQQHAQHVVDTVEK